MTDAGDYGLILFCVSCFIWYSQFKNELYFQLVNYMYNV